MKSSKPYFIRAVYEWLTDCDLTPYVLVNAEMDGLQIPREYVEDGQIIFNIAPESVRDLSLTNGVVSFDARFSGLVQTVIIPVRAVDAIYASENGRGMVFDEDDEDGGSDDHYPDDQGGPSPDDGGKKPPKGKKPFLTVVK